MAGLNCTKCTGHATGIGLFHTDALGQQYSVVSINVVVWGCSGGSAIALSNLEDPSAVSYSLFLGNDFTTGVIHAGSTLDIDWCAFLENEVPDSDVVFDPSLSEGQALVTITFYSASVQLRNSRFSRELNGLDPSLIVENCEWGVESVPFSEEFRCGAMPIPTSSPRPSGTPSFVLDHSLCIPVTASLPEATSEFGFSYEWATSAVQASLWAILTADLAPADENVDSDVAPGSGAVSGIAAAETSEAVLGIAAAENGAASRVGVVVGAALGGTVAIAAVAVGVVFAMGAISARRPPPRTVAADGRETDLSLLEAADDVSDVSNCLEMENPIATEQGAGKVDSIGEQE
jgi:hypothetical protein